MRAALQRWLAARWYDGAPVPAWLRGLERLYGALAARRRTRGEAEAQRLPVPVIVVGNLSVGGTGKTPLVIALVQHLAALGRRPGVISRGYGGCVREASLLPPDADPACFGDEPVLIAARTGVPVAVGPDRVGAGRRLLADHPVDIIVSDDGLQHRRLARDLTLCVVDGRRRFGNGRQLPAGPLREPLAALAGYDLVLVNGPRGGHEAGYDLQPAPPRRLRDGGDTAWADWAGRRVHAVAGIGDPERFFTMLESLGLLVERHPFPDHHAYRSEELQFAPALPVLMTEKDAVKCRAFAGADWHVVAVSARLSPQAQRQLDALLGPLLSAS